MKLCIILFSTYLLLLCATPCILEPQTEKSDICCNSSPSTKDQKDNSDGHHGCNPLRGCSCALSYSADLPAFVLLISASASEPLKILSQQSFYSLIVTSIWQPPKIS